MNIWRIDKGMEKLNKSILSKYEVSVLGISVFTLLPTYGVLVFQVIKDFKAGETNNFRIYFVTGFVFLAFLLLSTLVCIRYAKEKAVSKVLLYGTGIMLFVLILADSFSLTNIAIVRSLTDFLLFAVRYLFYRKYRHLFYGI